ncbi:hypothetical protein AWQ21_11000 [Picosynechococcus sp. PCC 7003]|uniref:DUF11 domain-containing protein n=1 Tax=Picosynechococcus sp. PCC 7003 TaxID=374981 RepID=UPI000810CC82|nr:DUF11 domain-containing protein [Picosynechococcus sp. PCC 7003]ANV84859.1 hypothetical protein AWQ21_11000 [Picosynechococcus sp. PCC 7003]
MKRSLAIFSTACAIALGCGVVNLPKATSLLGLQPVAAQQNRQVDLKLAGHLRVIERNWRGQTQVAWRSLEGTALRPAPKVKPGDIVRYTISGNNQTNQAVSGLVLTDDLPANTVYVMNSAATVGGATITYSIDGGRTYTANPTIQVTLEDGRTATVPAPPERYTHIRWTFSGAVPPRSAVSGQYQVRVQ